MVSNELASLQQAKTLHFPPGGAPACGTAHASHLFELHHVGVHQLFVIEHLPLDVDVDLRRRDKIISAVLPRMSVVICAVCDVRLLRMC